MGASLLPPSGFMNRFLDFLSEFLGIYRIYELRKRNVIAFSATIKSPSRLISSRNISIQKGVILHCGGKVWSNYLGYIQLGHDVKIGPYCVIYGAGCVEIGNYVHLGPGVKIMSQSGKHDNSRLTHSPNYTLSEVSIGEGSWIGTNAVILGGTQIGRCVSIAPNSVVSGIIPDYAVVAGNPGRMVFSNQDIS